MTTTTTAASATTSAAEGDWPTTMRAWQYNSATAGLDKALHLNETTTPPAPSALSPTAVLVQVHFMSVNPADYKLVEMGLVARALVAPPASPGMDFSGRVVAVGSALTATYQPGQLVFGRVEPTKYGTLGQYIVVKNADGLARVPEGMEDRLQDLAAVGTCGLTAIQTIQPYVQGSSGSGAEGTAKVFINGGSGGTGTFGIQIAKALGCHVTASCSGRNAELCRELGADEVIDYTAQNVSDVLSSRGPVFSLVVDNVGFSPPGQEDLYTAANKYVKDDGWFVQVGGGASKEMVKAVFKRAFVPGLLGGGKRHWKFAMTRQSHEDLAKIAGWMKEGKVKAVIDEVFDFQRAPEAYTKLKTGRTKGKIVVKMLE